MALNPAAVRRDLPYLRRRVKAPAAQPAAGAGAGAGSGAGASAGTGAAGTGAGAGAGTGATPTAAPGSGYRGGHPIVPRARGAAPSSGTADGVVPSSAPPGGGYRSGHPIVPRPPGATRPGAPDPARPTAPSAQSASGSGGAGLDLSSRGGGVAGSGGGAGLDLGSRESGSGGGLDLGARGSAGGGSGGLDLGSRTTSAAEAAGTRPGEPRASGAPGSSAPTERRVRPARPERPGPFPAPAVDDVRELGLDEPVLRLNPRESAVGSLIVSGTSSIAWETTDLITGAATPDGGSEGTPVSTPGNRALVGYDGPDAIVSLRHLHQLRRALFIGTSSGPIGVQLFDGSSFTVSTPDRSPLFALSLLRVGNLIELRAEPVTREATAAQLHREFGFSMTPHLTAREPRRR